VEDVIRLRSPVKRDYAGTAPALKLWALLTKLKAEKSFSHTFGCLDPVQVPTHSLSDIPYHTFICFLLCV
jgi:isocitrate lyase